MRKDCELTCPSCPFIVQRQDRINGLIEEQVDFTNRGMERNQRLADFNNEISDDSTEQLVREANAFNKLILVFAEQREAIRTKYEQDINNAKRRCWTGPYTRRRFLLVGKATLRCGSFAALPHVNGNSDLILRDEN